jgi:hypothetical protein
LLYYFANLCQVPVPGLTFLVLYDIIIGRNGDSFTKHITASQKITKKRGKIMKFRWLISVLAPVGLALGLSAVAMPAMAEEGGRDYAPITKAILAKNGLNTSSPAFQKRLAEVKAIRLTAPVATPAPVETAPAHEETPVPVAPVVGTPAPVKPVQTTPVATPEPVVETPAPVKPVQTTPVATPVAVQPATVPTPMETEPVVVPTQIRVPQNGQPFKLAYVPLDAILNKVSLEPGLTGSYKLIPGEQGQVGKIQIAMGNMATGSQVSYTLAEGSYQMTQVQVVGDGLSVLNQKGARQILVLIATYNVALSTAQVQGTPDAPTSTEVRVQIVPIPADLVREIERYYTN